MPMKVSSKTARKHKCKPTTWGKRQRRVTISSVVISSGTSIQQQHFVYDITIFSKSILIYVTF